MNDYWRTLYNTISRTPGYSLLEQVGKTLNGTALPQDQVDLIARSAAEALDLKSNDQLIDLCCGNGVITERLAPLVSKVWGFDLSEGLIEVAISASKSHNVEYVHSDILRIDNRYFMGTRKILMNEALQHFSEIDIENLLRKMTLLESDSLIYFSGIPDQEKIWLFYDNPEKRAFYERREREGRSHSGKWWLRSKVKQIAGACGFEATIVPQKSAMVTSYYRFDLLLRK